MKMRIKGNFIRYRLTKTEVQQLSESGVVSEKTFFSKNNILTYTLKTKTDVIDLQVEFNNADITIFINSLIAKEWNNNQKVGYRGTVSIDERENNVLVLLVEKDFQCLDETEEDQSDNYPNPLNDNQI